MKRRLRAHCGFALLALLLALLGVGASLHLLPMAHQPIRLNNEERINRNLALAREALIARAVLDENRPGSLPCPAPIRQIETPDAVYTDGRSALFAGNRCPSQIGRLPWSTLDTPQPLDASAGTLWYVVAPGLRDHSSASPINSDTATGLMMDDEDNIAALIIAPGPALKGQQRPSNNDQDYLEGQLETLPGQPHRYRYRSTAESNDIIQRITRQQLMAAVEQGVGRQLLHCLDSDASIRGRFPWPAPLGSQHGNAVAGALFGRIPLTHPGNFRDEIDRLEQAVRLRQHPAADLLSWANSLSRALLMAAEQVTDAASKADIAPMETALRNTGLDNNQTLLGLTSSQSSLSELRAALSQHALQIRQEAEALQTLLNSKPTLEQLQQQLGSMAHSRQTSHGQALPTIWSATACGFLEDPKGWWQQGKWADSLFYQISAPDLQHAGQLRVGSRQGLQRVVIVAGSILPGQQRPSDKIHDYLENRNADPSREGDASTPNLAFDHRPDRSPNNDQLVF